MFALSAAELAEALPEGGDFSHIWRVYDRAPKTRGRSNVGGKCGRHLFKAEETPARIQAVFDKAFEQECLRGTDRAGLFAKVREWALGYLDFPVPWRRTEPPGPDQGDSIEYTAAQCRGLLANAFLGNVLDPMAEFKGSVGGLDFLAHYLDGARDEVGVQKTTALLMYFERGMELAGTEDDNRRVTFVHQRGPSDEAFSKLLSDKADLPAVGGGDDGAPVRLHSEVMEAPEDATAFVNFANAFYGVGCFISCCTQEEILQMACPEMNAGMLHIGRMRDDEVVVARNCRRFIEYRGYGDTFQVARRWARDAVVDVLAMDAVFNRHYRTENQLRDVKKAYTAFAVHRGPAGCSPPRQLLPAGAAVVSSGRWGCGCFGGVPAHKLAQQIIAARLAGVVLLFSTFGTPDGCDVVVRALEQHPCTVGKLWCYTLGAQQGAGRFDRMLANGLGAATAKPKEASESTCDAV